MKKTKKEKRVKKKEWNNIYRYISYFSIKLFYS